MFTADGRDTGKLLFWQDAAGGIRWAVKQQDASLWSNEFFQILRVDAESGVIGVQVHGRATKQIDQMFVHHEIRVGDDDFVAFFDQGEQC